MICPTCVKERSGSQSGCPNACGVLCVFAWHACDTAGGINRFARHPPRTDVLVAMAVAARMDTDRTRGNMLLGKEKYVCVCVALGRMRSRRLRWGCHFQSPLVRRLRTPRASGYLRPFRLCDTHRNGGVCSAQRNNLEPVLERDAD